jgi:hypothetical protein
MRAQVQLEHDGGKKDTGLWSVDVDHSTAKCENTESVFIIATITGTVTYLKKYFFL